MNALLVECLQQLSSPTSESKESHVQGLPITQGATHPGHGSGSLVSPSSSLREQRACLSTSSALVLIV